MTASPRIIRIFTPSYADEANTNAQNLTVKEIIARLPEDRFHITMIRDGAPDERLARRRNTQLIPWVARGNARRLLMHCLTTRPDIYFYPREGVLDYAFLRARRYFRLGTAVVTHVVKCFEPGPGLPPKTLADRALRAAICEASAVYGNSKYVASTVADRFGVEAGTIHNGIDSRFFYPSVGGEHWLTGTGGLTVLYAGSFQARKRPQLVVQLAERWPQVAFRMAGDGEERAACAELATRLGCTNVTLLGHLPLEALGHEMRRSDVFLFPSLVEGHPQVLGQAAACGLPVVAMRAYHPDFVEDGRTGLLAADDQALVAALDQMLTNHALRVTMAELAFAHAGRFTWDDATAKWADVFERVVQERRSTSFRFLNVRHFRLLQR